MKKPRITQLYELSQRIIYLFEGVQTVNAFDCMQEQLDLSGYFYRSHKEDVYRLYHLLVHCLTCLHSLYRLQDKKGRYQSTREDNVLALQLLNAECFDHSYLPETTWETYQELMGYYGTANPFTRKEAEAVIVLNEHTFKWRLQKLHEHGYVLRIGGSMYKGYRYRLIDKLNPFELSNTLEAPIEEDSPSIFEEMLPDEPPKLFYPLQ